MEKRGDQKESPTETNLRMLAELKTELANYKQSMDIAVSQLFQNQEAMKAGLDSAELNLRTFQKVINGVVEHNVLLIPAPEPPPMSEVLSTAAKINWQEYYALVDAEMRAMELVARERELHKTKARLKVLVEDKKLEWLKEHIHQQIADQKAPPEITALQMRNTARFFESVQVHVDRAQEGGLYDTNRLDQIMQMIAVAEKKGEAPQAAPPAEALGRLSDEDSEHNGDTVVFGGDVKEVVHEAHDD